MTKKHKNSRNHYNEAFRKEAVRLADQPGASATKVAEKLGIHPGQIYNWRRQFTRLTEKQFNSMNGVDYSKEESEKVRKLERENANLKEEITFLKKAAAYFSNQNK